MAPLDGIEKLASDIVIFNKIMTPAVPIKDIVKKYDLDVIPYNLGDGISGTLVMENNKGFIGYNPAESKFRQRFTIAHELGHYLLHVKNLLNYKNLQARNIFVDISYIVKYRSAKNYTPSEWKQEQQANAFAAAILMPIDFIEAELNKPINQTMGEGELIESLAKIFEVSVPAMTFRLNNLNSSR